MRTLLRPASLVLILIVLFGAALRTYDLSTVPPELIADELDLYNSASSIATTGHDVDGSLAPFFYSKYTRNPPLYGVAAYASSLLFGRTPFGLRLPAVLFGIATIVLVAGIGLELTGREDVALVAALIAAISPIFIQFSRVAWEPSSELAFLLGSLYVLLRTFRRAASKDGPSFASLALAAVLLALTCYTYMAGWFYAMLLGGAMVLLNARRISAEKAWPRIAAASALWLVLAWPALQTILFDPLTVWKTQRIGTFSNGVTADSLRTFALNYIAHFRWSYLVTTGDPIIGVTWRYLNGFGAFYGWVVALAIVGLATVNVYVGPRWRVLWVLVWLAAYPLGGALTNEGAPNAPRTLAGAPIFCILAGIGFAYIADLAGSIANLRLATATLASARVLLSAVAVISASFFASFYFTGYVHQNADAWDSGTRAMFASVRSHLDGYTRVCFDIHPGYYQVETYVAFYLSDLSIPKITQAGAPECYQAGTLLVTAPKHPVLPGFVSVASVKDVDSNTFAVLTGRSNDSHQPVRGN